MLGRGRREVNEPTPQGVPQIPEQTDSELLAPAEPTERKEAERTVGQADRSLLARVSPEVIAVLGEETVLGIEQLSHSIDWIDELAHSPDPFDNKDRSGEADFSFMKPKQVAQVEDFIAARADRKGREELLKGLRSSILAGRSFKLGKLAYAAYAVSRLKIKKVRSTLDRCGTDINELVNSQSQGHRLDLEAAEAHVNTLSKAGLNLPTETTLQIIRDMFKIAENLQQKISERSLSRLVRATADRQKRRISPNVEKVERLIEYSQLTGRLGSVNHELLQSLVQEEEVVFVASLLELVMTSKESLAARLETGEPQSAATLEAERYLAKKAETTESVLRNIDPKILDLPEIKSLFGGLRTTPLADVEQSRKEHEQLERISGLSNQITEARDILKGGRRLESSKDLPNPETVADDLYNLLSDEEKKIRLLSPEESGVIIAILADRFSSFLDTLERVQRDAPDDEVLKTVTGLRPGIIKSLHDFNIVQHTKRLTEILQSERRKELLRTLRESNVIKLEAALAEFAKREKEPARPAEPTERKPVSVETFLGKDELFARLDWTVLPEGELELEKAAREIVADAEARAIKGTNVVIDLDRLNILKKIRDNWGRDKCYYARGSLSGRRRVYIEGQENPDEYIVLVLQQLDDKESVVAEHAIAESPIAGHNALYVFREDVSEGLSWREVYSLPKLDTRELGARRIKHTKAEDDTRPLVDVMTDRVASLLSVEPAEFPKVEFHGRSVRVAKRPGDISN